MTLLLDINIVVDLLARRNPHVLAAAKATKTARTRGDAMGLYVGSVQTMLYVLYSELGRFPPAQIRAGTNRERMDLAKEKLDRFSSHCFWIPATEEDGIAIFQEDDVEDAQLIRAARRTPGLIILTRDIRMLKAAPDVAISPENYLRDTHASV